MNLDTHREKRKIIIIKIIRKAIYKPRVESQKRVRVVEILFSRFFITKKNKIHIYTHARIYMVFFYLDITCTVSCITVPNSRVCPSFYSFHLSLLLNLFFRYIHDIVSHVIDLLTLFLLLIPLLHHLLTLFIDLFFICTLFITINFF